MPSPMAKTIHQLARRHGTYNVFADTWAMSSYAMSNAVDKPHYDDREAAYMRTVSKYSKDEANEIAHLFAMLALELDVRPRDVLGELFHELEIHNEHAGQFFTPWNLCQMMAKMNTAGTDIREIIDRKGYVSLHEPACGSGAMVIAMAGALADEEINYQQAMHVTAIDIDIRCVHMAYTQFSLLHIPATVIHGNALSLETWATYKTPAHIMGDGIGVCATVKRCRAWRKRSSRNQLLRFLPRPSQKLLPFLIQIRCLKMMQNRHVKAQIIHYS